MAGKRASSQKQWVDIEGHRLALTNLEKVLYPETGTTKADVLAYYTQVAPVLLPAARNRPVTRKRWVHGVGTAAAPGQVFFQKNLEDAAPDWVPRGTIDHKDHSNDYPLLNDLATLTWLAQIAALEIHVPQWQFDARGTPGHPDRLVLDLDPGQGAGLAECAEVARLARAILEDMGLTAVPVTSGSKGIHLYAPLDGRQTSEEASAVAHELARALEADHPQLVVSQMKKSLRPGKVLVDWSQNNANKTTIVPYSLRGRAHPMVAAPRTWDELAAADLAQLDYRTVLDRVAQAPDPFAALDGEPAFQRTGGKADGGTDRLATYRAKRDASRTPEPVPAHGPDGSAPGTGNSFVIQEHHARRLHWDFRLEHDGVLVSWALPKGVPTDTGKNHLAVQTEDHPLDYGSFEGTIPAGEYGGGTVTIWDAGTYELEKWRDGKEVIATLTGRPDGGLDGPRRYALVNTAGNGPKSQWLIHLMKDQDGESPRHAAGHGRTPSNAAAAAGRPGPSDVPEPGPESGPEPMLATLGDAGDLDGGGWALEMKWDGIRALAEISGGRATLVSRNGNDVTASYPELAARIAEQVPVDAAVLDGEIVALDEAGRPDFGVLQSRMKLTRPGDVKRAARTTPVHYIAFDLLAVGENNATGLAFSQRRALLEELLADLASVPTAAPSAGTDTDSEEATGGVQDGVPVDAGIDGGVHADAPGGPGRVHLSPLVPGGAEDALDLSRELGLEGIVAKRTGSSYQAGRRSPDWIKVKHSRTQEVVVGGWRDGKGVRAGTVGSLLVGIPAEDGTLAYAGRVGTGFGEEELSEIAATMHRMARKTPPFTDVPAADARDAHWVTPTLVGEVAYSQWTGGGKLRNPVWRGWRPDKSAQEVVREDARTEA